MRIWQAAAVVFEVKINSIDEGKLPEINDALIASLNLGYDTVDACRQNVEDLSEKRL